MFKFLSATLLSAALCFPAHAETLTAEALKKLVDERTAQASPMLSLLNDPDPVRSLAAVELMIESGDPKLQRMAIDFGLLSALPEVRRAAFLGLMTARPTLQISVELGSSEDESVIEKFKHHSAGVVMPEKAGLYSINIGQFDAEKNCYFHTGTNVCALQLGPTGVSIFKKNGGQSWEWVRTILSFDEPGQLTGATSIGRVTGGFPTTMALID